MTRSSSCRESVASVSRARRAASAWSWSLAACSFMASSTLGEGESMVRQSLRYRVWGSRSQGRCEDGRSHVEPVGAQPLALGYELGGA